MVCTLILELRLSDNWPVVLASTRDELRARPATGPSRWVGEDFVAPRDEQAGGTWLGLNRHGVFAAVTNRAPPRKDPARRSRGALVAEALRATSPTALHARLAQLSPREFNAFHLLYGSAERAFVTWSDGDAVQQAELPPGLHVVTERSLSGATPPRETLVRQRWPRFDAAAPVPLAALQALLSTAVPGAPFEGVEVDVPEFGYGTRSSSLLLLGRPATASRWFWGDGRPSQAPLVERPELVAALR